MAEIFRDVILLPYPEPAMLPRDWDTTLYAIAEGQLGYFTAAQARAAGVHPVRLVQLAKRGDIERVSRGVYRLTRYPLSPLGQYMEAALWPQVHRSDTRGVVSYASALAIYGLSDVSPATVHLTLPTAMRVRRTVPRHLVLHYADLAQREVQQVEGVPVTRPERTIRDIHADHIGPALVRQAIADGRRTGHLTFDQADRLERELLGTKPAAKRRPTVRSGPTT